MSILSVCNANGIRINDRRKVSMGGGGKRALSRVTHIARHHSGVNVDQSMSILEGYWKSAHGWVTGGYHVVIHFDGSVDWNYDYDTVSNGVGNHNSYIFNISVLGNGKFTAAQEKSWQVICKEAQRELGIPTKNVWGHKEFSGHAYNSCPGINMNTVRAALNSGKPVGGSNVTPNTNLKPVGKKVKVGTQAKQWETGSDIPKFVIGQTYDVLQEKAVNKSRSKKAYLIGKGTVATGWLLEQDVEGFSTTATPAPSTGGKLAEDGILGYSTYAALQKYFGTPVDGLLSVPSPMVKKLQELVGTPADGIIGANTIKAMQSFFGTPVDGILSSPSSVVVKEIQKRLNAGNLGTKKAAATPVKQKSNITVDGYWGAGTTRELQTLFGTPADGVISGQGKNAVSQNITGVTYGSQGSLVIKALQKKLGVGQDGKIGPGTFKALQKHLGTTQDGVMSKPSLAVKELQRRLNAGTF